MTAPAGNPALPSQRHVLLVFLDGIGLGNDDAQTNPFAAANTPTLTQFTGGRRWVREIGQHEGEVGDVPFAFTRLDPRMGVPGRPQSATGQAAIVTGRNIPRLIGEHYGPRPNVAVRALLDEDNVFKQVVARGGTAALLEAYPPQWHDAINSGKRLPASYQYAPLSAGIRLFGERDLYNGDALTMDWTGEGFRQQLGYTDSPLYSPEEAGRKMVELATRYTYSFFAHWWTDTVGHRGTVADGVQILELFDRVMAGAIEAWRAVDGLMLVTSDHGNMEDMAHGKHTENDVPFLAIGNGAAAFTRGLHTLADITPRVLDYLFTP